MIRGLLNYLENFAVLSYSLFLGDFLFFKSLGVVNEKGWLWFLKRNGKKWEKEGNRENKTSLGSTRKMFPGEKLWTDCISLWLDCSMLLIWKRDPAVPLLLSDDWEAVQWLKLLHTAAPASRESCSKNQYKNRVFRVWASGSDWWLYKTILFINFMNIYLVPTMWRE